MCATLSRFPCRAVLFARLSSYVSSAFVGRRALAIFCVVILPVSCHVVVVGKRVLFFSVLGGAADRRAAISGGRSRPVTRRRAVRFPGRHRAVRPRGAPFGHGLASLFGGIRSPPLRCSPACPSHALPAGSTTASHGDLQTAQHQVLAASRRAPWTRGRRRGSCGARTRRRPRRGERRERASFEG